MITIDKNAFENSQLTAESVGDGVSLSKDLTSAQVREVFLKIFDIEAKN